MKLPDLDTCKHGTPMMTPCPTCDAAYGPVEATPEEKLRYLYRHTGDLETQLAEARAVLKEVEWIEDWEIQDDRCPRCNRPKQMGHSPDCRLKKALGEM